MPVTANKILETRMVNEFGLWFSKVKASSKMEGLVLIQTFHISKFWYGSYIYINSAAELDAVLEGNCFTIASYPIVVLFC